MTKYNLILTLLERCHNTLLFFAVYFFPGCLYKEGLKRNLSILARNRFLLEKSSINSIF